MACDLEFTLQGPPLEFELQGVFGGGTVCPDGTVTVLNSLSDVVDTVTVTSGGTANGNAPDGTVNMLNTDGLQLYSKDTPSDGTVSQELADQPYMDSDGSSLTQSYDPSTPIVCTPCTPLSSYTAQELNDGLTAAVRPQLQLVPVIRTGQTTSKYTGDDASVGAGRPLVDWLTLSTNNPNGNTNRFELYSAGIVFDWATGKAWTKNFQGSKNLPTACAFGATLTVDGVTGWIAPNKNELQTILKAENEALNYVPFSFSQGASFKTIGTTTSASPSQYYYISIFPNTTTTNPFMREFNDTANQADWLFYKDISDIISI